MLSRRLQRHSQRVIQRHLHRSLSTVPLQDYKVENLYGTNYWNIPSLPLPTVDETVHRYLETIRPLATEEEFANTSKLAAEFISKDAAPLHAALVQIKDSAGYPHSYIEGFWDDMYLGGRWPAMVHVNPFYILNDETNPAAQAQAPRAANFVSNAARWWQKVVDGKLEPDMERGNPLCMYQYGHLFGAYRVPTEGRDTFVRNPHAKHIIVARNHQYYFLNVYDEDGNAIPAAQLELALEGILADNKKGDRSTDVGVLTTGERDAFARRRAEMIRDSPVNEQSFKTIDESLFVLVLEDDSCTDMVSKSKMALHGRDGSNRWFDKHQVILDSRGTLLLNFEHSSTDGLTWNRMLHEVWAGMHGSEGTGHFSPLPEEGPGLPVPPTAKKLDWELSDSIVSDIAGEAKIAEALANDVDTEILEFNDFGRNAAKQWKMSPDALAQMAMQLGYFKVHGQSAPTYEACSMKNWYHGRTETIRSCTTDSNDMCLAFQNNADDETKRSLLLKAAATHVNVAKGAKGAAGEFMGCDRHLFAMKNIADKLGHSVPFFNDPMYSKSGTWLLSTSNVTTPFFDLFGFGAVATDGYGLGYQTLENSMPFNITSFHSSKVTSSKKLANGIETSLKEFETLFK